MGDLESLTEDAELSVESIVQAVEDTVVSIAADIVCADEDIGVQMREYAGCEDTDYRLMYREDIETLVGQRSGLLDELYESIEAGREALGKVEMAVEAAYDRLKELEGDSERVPEDLNITIPPVYPSP